MSSTASVRRMPFFERWLTLWVLLAMAGGVALGRGFPGLAGALDSASLRIDGAPVLSYPIAIALFLMMFPIMVKIDFGELRAAAERPRPVLLTLVINWLVKPFTMFGLASLMLGSWFLGWIGPEATDLVRLPFGTQAAVGDVIGEGTVVLHEGVLKLQVPLWRSYLAGCILLGIAPCTAMVIVWSHLARASGGLTLIMVALNSLVMVAIYGLLGGWLLGVGQLPMPWEALALSIGVYVVLPLLTALAVRAIILRTKGVDWFRERFLAALAPLTIAALLGTLVLLFALQSKAIVERPTAIGIIAIPLALQTILIFALGFWLARRMRLRYEEAAPTAMIGASNHFEVAIATATMLFGLSSGAALATVVGVLIEVPLMLALVAFCKRYRPTFAAS